MKIHSWDFWDKKTILQTILFVSGFFLIILLFVFGPNVYRHFKEKTLDMTTTATITSCRDNTFRGRSGLYTLNMVINYKYIIDTVAYSNVEIVPYDGRNRPFLDSIYHSQITIISIKYSSRNPAKSLINIK
jgi:hypothetical protein